MKKIVLMTYLMLTVFFLVEGKVVQLPDLLAPNAIIADNGRLYIADGATIYIYSLDGFNLQKKFGREGEGPQDFKEKIYTLGIRGENLVVNSAAKLSYFTRDGNFVNVMRTPPQAIRFKPLKEKFTGVGLLVDLEQKTMYRTVNIYDRELKKEKEIARLEHEVQPGKGAKLFYGTLSVAVAGNRIFSAGATHFNIDVYNEKGVKTQIIHQQYRRREVTERDKNRLIEHLQTSPGTREYYEILKPIKFAEYYPALRELLADGGRLYALTWKSKDGETECYVFDFAGKLLGTVYLPVRSRDVVDFSPLTIHGGTLYQLVEDAGREAWELHITDIK